MADAPSIDAGEITDKAYINQRVVLDRRQSLVAADSKAQMNPRRRDSLVC